MTVRRGLVIVAAAVALFEVDHFARETVSEPCISNDNIFDAAYCSVVNIGKLALGEGQNVVDDSLRIVVTPEGSIE